MHLRILLSVCFLATCPLTAKADTYSDCQSAISADDRAAAEKLADIILRFRNVYSPEQQVSGRQCLTFAKGEEYEYNISVGQFLNKAESDSILTAMQASADELALQKAKRDAAEAERRRLREAEEQERLRLERIAEEEKSAKIAAVWRRVDDACFEVFADDATAALTNKVCVDIFLQTGLPTE